MTEEMETWEKDFYLGVLEKRRLIAQGLKQFVIEFSGDGIVGQLENKLRSTGSKAKKNAKGDVLVLHLVHAYAERGIYDKALKLLDDRRTEVIREADSVQYSGLLYVALLHGAISKKLELSQSNSPHITQNGNSNHYFQIVRESYLSPEIEQLMLGKPK